jgi:hypothetical protein
LGGKQWIARTDVLCSLWETFVAQELHALDEKLQSTLSEGGDLVAIKAAFEAVEAYNEPHLKHEESIMMPKVQSFVLG